MQRLTRNEEIKILKELMKEEEDIYLGSGSSRAVFSYDDDFCVKIAVDKQGQFQNHNEIELYEEYGSEFLAKIKSYGKFIVVMEKVKVYNPDDIQGAIYESEDEDEDGECSGLFTKDEECSGFLTKEEIKNLLAVKNNLDDILTETDDNFQLGKAKDGRIVAYDYGYLPYEHEKSVSHSLFQTIRSFDTFQGFLEYMVSRLLKTL